MARARPSIACPECGGRAEFAERTDTVEYKGRTSPVRVVGHWCEACGEGVLEGPALEKLQSAFFELRADVEGVLAPAEVAAIRRRLDLSQRRAGQLLGGGARAFQKYESGAQQVSVPMANLLRLLARDPRRLAELAPDEHGSRTLRASPRAARPARRASGSRGRRSPRNKR